MIGGKYMDFDFNTALLIHVGALFYIIAFLIRDELKLRLMVLAGSAFYLLYYYFFPQIPLWDAIITTCILVGANLVILFRILMERTVFAMSEQEKILFNYFKGFSPGQFRQLLKIARWTTAEVPTALATENQALSSLYIIADGQAEVRKGEHQFQLGPGSFVGEIAFVLKGLPTAHVTVGKGTRFVEWKTADIEHLMSKSSAFQNATMALLSRDLAEKLATSVQVAKLENEMVTI